MLGTAAASRSAILKTIYYRGPIKRSDIAKQLALTMPTITTNVNHMISSGLVKEEDKLDPSANSLGRKARPVSIVAEARHFVGIEMRGFQRIISVQDFLGRTLYCKKDSTPHPSYEENLRLSCDLLYEALDACGFTLDDITGIGFCVPGVVNSAEGRLDTLPSYGWRDKAVRADVASMTGYSGPISVENNACARAYGLRLLQKDLLMDVHNFTYFFISRGIACPLFLDTGNVVGSVVGAGEVGHMIMQPDGLLCSCGNRGCLEAYSSDVAVIARCKEALQQGKAPFLQQLCPDGELSMHDIIAAQSAGDEDVHKIAQEAVYRIGIAVANVVNFASSRIMFIDGLLFGVQENRDQLLNVIHTNLCNALHSDTEFRFVEPNDYSGASGAAALAIHNSLDYYTDQTLFENRRSGQIAGGLFPSSLTAQQATESRGAGGIPVFKE